MPIASPDGRELEVTLKPPPSHTSTIQRTKGRHARRRSTKIMQPLHPPCNPPGSEPFLRGSLCLCPRQPMHTTRMNLPNFRLKSSFTCSLNCRAFSTLEVLSSSSEIHQHNNKCNKKVKTKVLSCVTVFNIAQEIVVVFKKPQIASITANVIPSLLGFQK